MFFDLNLPIWATREMLSDCRQRDRLEKKAKRSGADNDWIKARQYRNRVTTFKKNLKKDYFVNALRDAGENPKKIVESAKTNFGDTEKMSENHGNKWSPRRLRHG